MDNKDIITFMKELKETCTHYDACSHGCPCYNKKSETCYFKQVKGSPENWKIEEDK